MKRSNPSSPASSRKKRAKTSKQQNVKSAQSTTQPKGPDLATMHKLDSKSTATKPLDVNAINANCTSLFPPTIYTNVEYSNGIRLQETKNGKLSAPPSYMVGFFEEKKSNDSSSRVKNKNQGAETVHYPYDPILQQPRLWSHKFAGKEAARFGYPMNVYRLLGTITRTVTATKAPTIWRKDTPPSLRIPGKDKRRRAKISKSEAKQQALSEFLRAENSSYTPHELETKIQEIQQHWSQYWSPDNLPQMLHPRHGHMLDAMIHDENHCPIDSLLRWKFTDGKNNEKRVDLYHGLRHVNVDTRTVLNSLADLQCPQSLYRIPIVLSYPCVVEVSERPKKKKGPNKTFELKIGIYAHRLLPEVMSERALMVVMTALDKRSFLVSQPLYMPPIPKTPTFESAKLPKLVYPEDVHNEEANDIIDLTTQLEQDEQTAEEGTVSAFSTRGLMRMWENTGTDVRSWPKLERQLQDSNMLRLSLLLHQQHALCWMVQMETLPGFGANSILWEERKWWDSTTEGDTYYYSPALGQLRLDKPQRVHGGVLADEMGLGKTIMILALIVVTLDDVKKQQESQGGQHTTLIVVPPALLGQWRSEIKKAAPQLNIEILHARTGAFENCSENSEDCNGAEQITPDVCITTYQALEQPKTARILQEYAWGRIVLDEMQEIRSSTTKIARSCDKLTAHRRWMLSGTPLFDGIEDLRGELNFLSLDPFCAKSEDGFFKFSITNHWEHRSRHGLETLKVLGLLLMRRSKTMSVIGSDSNNGLLGLPTLTVEFVPVAQSTFERALYCFLEYVVAMETNSTDDKSKTGYRLCLRLLRLFCISANLLSGGMGATSELSKLNHLLVKHNRRQFGGHSREDRRPLSCADAIRYLSQALAEIDSGDFVSDLVVGVGGGMAQRNRATDSVDVRIKESKTKLQEAEKTLQKAASARAKARWHWALEQITTGALLCYPQSKGGEDLPCQMPGLSIWRWRAAILLVLESKPRANMPDFPSILLRGWRPSERFAQELAEAHPDFAWVQPNALNLKNIPSCVTLSELKSSISTALNTNDHNEHEGANDRYKVVVMGGPTSNSATWSAVLQPKDANDATTLKQRSKARKGIALPSQVHSQSLVNKRDNAEKQLKEARNLYDVHPSQESKDRLKKAEKLYRFLEGGHHILAGSNQAGFCTDTSPHVLLSRSQGPIRSPIKPRTAESLYISLSAVIEKATESLATKSMFVAEQTKLIHQLDRALEIPDEIKEMSAFESLEALSMNEPHKTFCSICMGELGSAGEKETTCLVALTPCGHLFCEKCISHYFATCAVSGVPCPTCRKDLSSQKKLILVDPELSKGEMQMESEKRSKAKDWIEKAAKMLGESEGQLLDADTWKQLYLSIDVPKHVPQRGEPRLSALPKEVIAFFRAATCMSGVNNKANVVPDLPAPPHANSVAGLSTKMQALLHDLPTKSERSVVFASSTASIKHVRAVFDKQGIAHRAIFQGQDPEEAEEAVQEWKQASPNSGESTEASSNVEGQQDPAPSHESNPLVLLVQSGAAASGLTLTAACKMFFLEPFLRQEEEYQALARCHRFGQAYPVHAKVYYAPVSVESRLLDWRKRRAEKQSGAADFPSKSDTKLVYRDMMDIDDSDGDEYSDVEESKDNRPDEGGTENEEQTRFLLGVNE